MKSIYTFFPRSKYLLAIKIAELATLVWCGDFDVAKLPADY